MRRTGLCFLVWLIAFGAVAQVRINNTVDTTDTQLTEAIRFMSSYLSGFAVRNGAVTVPDMARYWPPDDCRRYQMPDRLLYAISTDIPTYILGTPKILSARPIGDLVQIRTIFSHPDSTGLPLVMSITDHYVGKAANGHLYFVNPMYLAEWTTKTYGHIEYHFPKGHKFDKARARKLAGEVEQLREVWGLQPIDIRYYFADTRDEVEHFRGFEFTLAMGNRDRPAGISDDADNEVYCWGLGEDYLHEVVHVYLNRLFPLSPLNEGLAVFYGGSMGHDLRWHLARLNTWLQQHPETDLNNMNDFYYMDHYTNPKSTIQGLLCLMAYEKGGLAAIRRTMGYHSFTQLLQQEYGVAANEWNTFLRKEIAGHCSARP